MLTRNNNLTEELKMYHENIQSVQSKTQNLENGINTISGNTGEGNGMGSGGGAATLNQIENSKGRL